MAKKKKAESVEKPITLEADKEVKPVHIERTTDLERELDEEFDYNSTHLHVLETFTYSCKGCFFWCNNCVNRDKSITGQCIGRKDRKSIIFKLVKNDSTRIN
jgi:hypothetical protein